VEDFAVQRGITALGGFIQCRKLAAARALDQQSALPVLIVWLFFRAGRLKEADRFARSDLVIGARFHRAPRPEQDEQGEDRYGQRKNHNEERHKSTATGLSENDLKKTGCGVTSAFFASSWYRLRRGGQGYSDEPERPGEGGGREGG